MPSCYVLGRHVWDGGVRVRWGLDAQMVCTLVVCGAHRVSLQPLSVLHHLSIVTAVAPGGSA
jgi:hypothetical protein